MRLMFLFLSIWHGQASFHIENVRIRMLKCALHWNFQCKSVMSNNRVALTRDDWLMVLAVDLVSLQSPSWDLEQEIFLQIHIFNAKFTFESKCSRENDNGIYIREMCTFKWTFKWSIYIYITLFLLSRLIIFSLLVSLVVVAGPRESQGSLGCLRMARESLDSFVSFQMLNSKIQNNNNFAANQNWLQLLVSSKTKWLNFCNLVAE